MDIRKRVHDELKATKDARGLLDRLLADGVLKHQTCAWYIVLKPEALPDDFRRLAVQGGDTYAGKPMLNIPRR